MVKRFDGKKVLVSGAGKGIGRAITLAFASEGAKVAFFDSDKKLVDQVNDDIAKYSDGNLAMLFDVTNIDSIDQFTEDLLKDFGGVDVLVNNVGVGKVKRFFDTTKEDLDLVLSTNFKGSFFLTQQVAKKMKPGSNIIFITSIHAEHPSLDPSYDASKAAINSLVANLALELAKMKIRVNAIAPGHIDVAGKKPRYQPDVPLGKRAGLPNDVAQACLFLADSNLSSYITGAILPVSGGIHIPIARDLKI